jgi:hypothetical protein
MAATLDSQRYDLRAGGQLSVDAKNKRCTLTLVSMDVYENTGLFDFTCADQNIRSSSR